MKRTLARIASRIERPLDRWSARDDVAGVIAPYIGYATPDHLVVRGRVLSKMRDNAVIATQSKWTNVKQMLRLFLTDEVANVPVTAQGVTERSDEEGYFTIHLPRKGAPGWVNVPVTAGDVHAECPVLIPDPEAAFGVISDIDDTQMKTGAFSLWRNVWTSLTGNALTREVFPDAVEMMTKLHDGGRNPIYYVSSSPWNLHGFLERVFERSGLPKGPMFLRDYGISETQFITGTHGDHKGSAIDTIMAANPDLPFILIGDTGQHDAQVYLDAIKRHDGRVSHVVLRAADKIDAKDIADINTIKATGVPVIAATDYTEAISILT